MVLTLEKAKPTKTPLPEVEAFLFIIKPLQNPSWGRIEGD